MPVSDNKAIFNIAKEIPLSGFLIYPQEITIHARIFNPLQALTSDYLSLPIHFFTYTLSPEPPQL